MQWNGFSADIRMKVTGCIWVRRQLRITTVSQSSWWICHFLLQRIFPTQGSSPCLLHCRQVLYPCATWEGPPIMMNLNCPCPRGRCECQAAERFPEWNGKYVYSTMENTCFVKTWLYQTFPLASYWDFKLWNFHHASIPPHSLRLYPLITWA